MRALILFGLALLVLSPLQAQQRTRSPHGDLKTECNTCHGPNGWTPVRIAKTFDHSRFGFALAGAHVTATCRACHQSLDFKGVKSDCVSCHVDKHRGELGANCNRCHTARSFLDRDVMIKAHQLYPFPLEGGHLGVDCSSCHKPGGQGSLQFVGTQSECVSCHKSNYATAPNHVASNFPTACAGCHTTVAWNRVAGLGGSHPSAPIALTGVHGHSQCTDCHLAGQPYSAVRQTCDACHHADYVATTNPSHTAAGFVTTCTTCHALVAGWAGATYATHSTAPINPTQGAHGAVTCTQCHTRSPYSSAPTTCDGCHHPDYVATTNPNHTAAGYTTDCASCHQVVANWAGATVNHPTAPIALTGVHSNRLCTDCHLPGQAYTAVQRTCDGCHHADYVATTNPSHTAAVFSTTCTTCHALVAGWAGATYAHATTPIDPKQGAHGAVTCTQCHTTSPYSTVKTTCDGCHHPDYVATTNPNHTAAGYSTDCASCHQVVASWAGATVNHPTAPIALTGVHSNRLCTDCHLPGQAYTAVQRTCDGCHHADYVATINPSHTAAVFSTTCTTCHALVAGWAGATYAHATTPIDPKQGAHGAVTCTQCHTTSPYSTVKTTCDGCHHVDYVATTNPSHTAASFPITCADCHQIVAAWNGATYASHPSTPLAMTGQHAMPPRTCTDCHTTATYASVATSCDGCHHATYVAVTDPNHTAAGMAEFAAANCTNCHSPTKSTWAGPTWTHNIIPVIPNPGNTIRLPHQGASCADCHQTANNYTITSCMKSGCHQFVDGPH